MRQALSTWNETHLTLALDTTLLFNTWCVICVSLVYRGRALPVAWRVLRHASSVVRARESHPVLASVQSLLMHLPDLEQVCINADRGFMDQELMADFTAFGWHWNIRGKGQVLVTDAAGRKQGKLRELYGVELMIRGQAAGSQWKLVKFETRACCCMSQTHR